MTDKVILRFNKVFFEHSPTKPILDEVSFSLRQGSKITLMGQNGAGKSTLFQLITGKLKPDSGAINIESGVSIATAWQVMPRDYFDLTVKELFEKVLPEKVYDIDPRIDKILEVVNLHAPHEKIIKSFSGGQ